MLDHLNPHAALGAVNLVMGLPQDVVNLLTLVWLAGKDVLSG
jgi:hypothetical protein